MRRSATNDDRCSVCSKKVGAGTLACARVWYCREHYPDNERRIRLEVECAIEHDDLDALHTVEILMRHKLEGRELPRTEQSKDAPLSVTLTRERWGEIRRAMGIMRMFCENFGPTTKKRADEIQGIEMDLVSQGVRS